MYKFYMALLQLMKKGFGATRKQLVAIIGMLVVLASVTAPGVAFAASDYSKGFPHGDKNDAADPNFDIKNVHREGDGKLVMQVFGQAGGTTPDKPATGELGQVYVYVFFTDAGIMVINAHWECHEGATGCDPEETHVSEWHAEFVTVDNVAGYDNLCVTQIYGERPATVDGHKAWVDTPEATKVIRGQTASFDLHRNPDLENPDNECIAELNTVFDST